MAKLSCAILLFTLIAMAVALKEKRGKEQSDPRMELLKKAAKRIMNSHFRTKLMSSGGGRFHNRDALYDLLKALHMDEEPMAIVHKRKPKAHSEKKFLRRLKAHTDDEEEAKRFFREMNMPHNVALKSKHNQDLKRVIAKRVHKELRKMENSKRRYHKLSKNKLQEKRKREKELKMQKKMKYLGQ